MSRLVALIVALAAAFFSLAAVAQWNSEAGYQDSIYPDPANVPDGGRSHFGQSLAVDRNPDGSLRALYVGLPATSVTVAGVELEAAGKVEVRGPGPDWPLITTLQSSTPQQGAQFGRSLAVKNGVLVIGEPEVETNGYEKAGRVYIYQDVNHGVAPQPSLQWRFTTSLLIDGATGGASVAVEGSGLHPGDLGVWVAWGAPKEAGKGCVRVFHYSSSGATNKTSACGPADSRFGSAVALWEQVPDADAIAVAVGAPDAMHGGHMLAGQVSTYATPLNSSPDLILQKTLNAENFQQSEAFGSSVAYVSRGGPHAGRLLVGASGRRDPVTNQGTGSVSVYVPCLGEGYCLDRELFAAGPVAGASCGSNLAFDHDPVLAATWVAAGCPNYADGQNGAGAVMYFRLGGSRPWLGNAAVAKMGSLPHGADRLGDSVAIAGRQLFAGASSNHDVNLYAGAVRVFNSDMDRIFADGFD